MIILFQKVGSIFVRTLDRFSQETNHNFSQAVNEILGDFDFPEDFIENVWEIISLARETGEEKEKDESEKPSATEQKSDSEELLRSFRGLSRLSTIVGIHFDIYKSNITEVVAHIKIHGAFFLQQY